MRKWIQVVCVPRSRLSAADSRCQSLGSAGKKKLRWVSVSRDNSSATPLLAFCTVVSALPQTKPTKKLLRTGKEARSSRFNVPATGQSWQRNVDSRFPRYATAPLADSRAAMAPVTKRGKRSLPMPTARLSPPEIDDFCLVRRRSRMGKIGAGRARWYLHVGYQR